MRPIGTMMAICQDKRGRFVRTEYLSPERVMLVYDVPLGEILPLLYQANVGALVYPPSINPGFPEMPTRPPHVRMPISLPIFD